MSLLDNLPHTCKARIRARGRSPGDIGTRDGFEEVLFDNMPCWRQPASDKEIRDFEQRGVHTTNKLYFTSDPGLNEKHIVDVTDENGNTVEGYDVVSAADPDASAGLGILYRVMLDNVNTGSPYP